MNATPLEHAHDPDIRLSLIALQRAARRAREVAIHTGTALVVVRDGVLQEEDPRSATRAPLRVQDAP